MLLEKKEPSLIHRLNRAVAVAEWKGAEAGLAVLSGFEVPGWLADFYLWSAVLADLFQRNGSIHKANSYHQKALNSAPTPALKKLLKKRFVTIQREYAS